MLVKAASPKIIAEEAPGAYKDIDQVVQVSHELGIVEKVVRLVPMGVVKG
ncbi:MAG: RtcB family protein [Promethearchaeota archaeon]